MGRPVRRGRGAALAAALLAWGALACVLAQAPSPPSPLISGFVDSDQITALELFNPECTAFDLSRAQIRRLEPVDAVEGWAAAPAHLLTGTLPPGGAYKVCSQPQDGGTSPPPSLDPCDARTDLLSDVGKSPLRSFALFVDGVMVDLLGGQRVQDMLPKLDWTLKRASTVTCGSVNWPQMPVGEGGSWYPPKYQWVTYYGGQLSSLGCHQMVQPGTPCVAQPGCQPIVPPVPMVRIADLFGPDTTPMCSPVPPSILGPVAVAGVITSAAVENSDPNIRGWLFVQDGTGPRSAVKVCVDAQGVVQGSLGVGPLEGLGALIGSAITVSGNYTFTGDYGAYMCGVRNATIVPHLSWSLPEPGILDDVPQDIMGAGVACQKRAAAYGTSTYELQGALVRVNATDGTTSAGVIDWQTGSWVLRGATNQLLSLLISKWQQAWTNALSIIDLEPVSAPIVNEADSASLAYLGPIDRISSLTLAAVPASWSTDEVQTYTSANAKAPSTQSGGAGTPSPASTPGAPTPSQAPPSAATGMALKSNACPTDNPRVGTPVAVVGTVTAAVAVLDDTCQGPSGQPQTGFTVFLQDSAAPGSGIAVALPCDLAGPLASSDGFLPPVGSTAQVLGTLVRVPGALAPVIDPSAMFLVETIASDRPVPSWVSSDTLAAIAGVNLWPWWGGAGTGATSCGPHPAGAYLGLALALPHVVAVPVDGASIATIQLPPGSFPAGTWAASTTQPASPSSPAAAPQPATPPTQPPATPPPMSPPGPSSAVTVPPLAGAAPVGGGTRRAALAARALQAPAAQRASEASSRRVRQATHAAHAALTKAMQAGGTVLAIATVPESVASLVQAAVDAGDIALVTLMEGVITGTVPTSDGSQALSMAVSAAHDIRSAMLPRPTPSTPGPTDGTGSVSPGTLQPAAVADPGGQPGSHSSRDWIPGVAAAASLCGIVVAAGAVAVARKRRKARARVIAQEASSWYAAPEPGPSVGVGTRAERAPAAAVAKARKPLFQPSSALAPVDPHAAIDTGPASPPR